MKKVLIVNDGFPPLSWGGANTIAFLHAKGLVERGYDVKIFTTTQDPAVPIGWSMYEGLSIRTFYTRYHPRWWAYKSLHNHQVTGAFAKELRAFAPDIVHFHNIHHFFSYRCISLAKKSGARVFLTAHDVMSFAYQKLRHFIEYSSKGIPATFDYHIPWRVNLKDARLRFNPFRNLITRGYLKKLDRIFAVSEALKQALEQNGIKGNIVVVHNGIDSAMFGQYFDHDALRSELGLAGKRIVLFVGRFTPDKGRDVTLRALAEVVKDVPDAKLLVVGYDPKRQVEPALERLLDELRMREHVAFVPAVPYLEIYKYYRVSDIVVVPSIIFDSFPTASIEGMAAGKPVIATCFGGAREAVEENVTGYIINPLDIDIFARKLHWLLTSPEEAKRMGEKGLRQVREKFALSGQISAYLSEY